MDVDYQANKNVLDEALAAGVKRFVWIILASRAANTTLAVLNC
jgi:nucleoside-diphosphate-sugar epimerase